MENTTFKLILRSKVFQMPLNIKYLGLISPNILNSLVVSTNHSYQINSDISEEVFQSFLDYLINDTLPNIQIENFIEYDQISQEFQILPDYVQSKKDAFGEFLININGLRSRKNQKLPTYEEEIATKLDEYLAKHGTALMNSPIDSLYNIFSHKKRNLSDHNLAYELIKKHFESSGDARIFVLLQCIDGDRLERQNLREAFLLRSERHSMMPRVDFEYVEEAVEAQRRMEEAIGGMSEKLRMCEEKIEELAAQHKRDAQAIGGLTRRVEEVKSQSEMEIQSLRKSHRDEIEKLTNQINEIKDQNEQKIASLIDSHQRDVEKMANEISEVKKQSEQEISSLKIAHRDDVGKLALKTDKMESSLKSVISKVENVGINCQGGIFQYLFSSNNNENPAEKGIIGIVGDSYNESCKANLLHIIDPSNYEIRWESKSVENSYFKIDFKEHAIMINMYRLRLGNILGEYFFTSWTLKGTTEDNREIIIDDVNNTRKITEENPEAIFEINNSSYFRSIQLTMKGTNSTDEYGIMIRNIEFFGFLK